MHTLRIITLDSPGLLNDAEIYKELFSKYNFDIEIFIIPDYNYKPDENNKKVDINLFLENIVPNSYNLKTKEFTVVKTFPSKLNLFMPNQELFSSYDELEYMNYILCKSKLAKDFFDKIKKKYNFKYTSIYTKFTTIIPASIENSKIKKDPNLFVHFAGKSLFKNTAEVVFCWIKNNGFIHIDKDIKLYITCYKSCYKYLLDNLNKKFNYKLKANKDVVQIGNLYLYTSSLSFDLYEQLLINANVAICPSFQEGYGHYINEARYFKTFIITVDAPPMNELVKDGYNGICIKDLKKNTKNWIKEVSSFELFTVSPIINKLRDAIIYCINNKNKISESGENGRKMYNDDKKYLKKTMDNFIDKKILPKL
jgi:glycosyltransferase involved in cell wall biosynthesis